MTPHCKDHELYHVDKLYLSHKRGIAKEGKPGHCKDCQLELAKAWAKEFGWECITKVSKRGTHKYWAKDNVFQSDDTDLISTILSPDGMIKATEHVKKLGWFIEMQSHVGFYKPFEDADGNHWNEQTDYLSIDEYGGEVIPRMITALQAVYKEENSK